MGEDMRVLQSGVQIVSGTPGRVYDMIRRRAFKTKHVKMLVIDEVSFLRFARWLCTISHWCFAGVIDVVALTLRASDKLPTRLP